MLRAWLRRLLGLDSVVLFDFCSLVLRLRCLLELVILLLPAAVPGVPGAMQRQVDSHSWASASLAQWWVRLARCVTGGGLLHLCFLLVVRVVLPVFLGVSRLWIRFSSAHFWSLFYWRCLSMVLSACAVDCCLSSLRAGVCSLLWRWRISARVLMVACLPLLRVGGTAPSPVPLMLVALTGFPVNHGLF